jgi:hypothetical protein
MKKSEICIVALLVVQSLWLKASLAGEAASPQFNEERSKQEQIYKSRGQDRPEGYVIDRSLLSYTDTLPPQFGRSLATLGPTDRWLDIGAGMGQAILDYFTPGYDRENFDGQEWPRRKAQAVAMSIEDRRTPLWQQTATTLEANQIRYLSDKRLREYSPEELGRFQVITDVIGGFSYTENLSLFMEKVLGLLELNGSYYTVLQDVHSEAGTNKPYYAGAPFLTQITNTDGSELKVCSWLKSITCVEVTCELKMRWKPPIEAYSIRKICDDVKVPALWPTHFVAGTPPERGFHLKR